MRQRTRIEKRLGIGKLAALDGIAHREFRDLAAAGAWNVGHLEDLRRHVSWARILAQDPANGLAQCVIQRLPVAQDHEQHHPDIILPALTYTNALLNLRQALDLAIDFRGADPHTTGIEYRVRAPLDDQPTLSSEHCPVTMGPDTRKARKVGITISTAFGIIPEAHGHAGKRAGTDQFPGLLTQTLAVGVKHVDGHAQAATLQLPPAHRQQRVSQRKAGDDIGTAGD